MMVTTYLRYRQKMEIENALLGNALLGLTKYFVGFNATWDKSTPTCCVEQSCKKFTLWFVAAGAVLVQCVMSFLHLHVTIYFIFQQFFAPFRNGWRAKKI